MFSRDWQGTHFDSTLRMVHSDWEEGVKNAEDLFAQIKLVKRLLSMNQNN